MRKPIGDRNSLSSEKHGVIFPRGKLLHSSLVATQKAKEKKKTQAHWVQLGVAIAEQVSESQPSLTPPVCLAVAENSFCPLTLCLKKKIYMA